MMVTVFPDEGMANVTLMIEVSYQEISTAEISAFSAYISGKLGDLTIILSDFCVDQLAELAPIVDVVGFTSVISPGVSITRTTLYGLSIHLSRMYLLTIEIGL